MPGRPQAKVVPAWEPRVEISAAAQDRQSIDGFAKRISAGFTAPAVEFGQPQALTVMGRHFAVISERDGLVPASIHTIGRFKWHQAFALVRDIRLLHECDPPPLIAASSGYDNYYHWTMETIGALLMHRATTSESSTPAVLPKLTASWQRQAIDLFDLVMPLIEVDREEAAVFDQAILTNLTSRIYGLCPHPEVVRRFREESPLATMPASHGKLIYVARLDAGGRRPMTNETELCDVLGRHGFEIIIPGAMSVRAQATAFAHAALIVAPHGAALTNLLYCDDGNRGPSVVELQQEAYLSPAYAKLSQAKRLDYMAIVHPCTEQADYHHDTPWRADVSLIENLVTRKLDQVSAKLR